MSEYHELVVDGLERVADDVLTVTLVDPDGGELPRWRPGAHVEVVVGGLTRHYSLCGSPGQRDRYRLGVLRDPNGRGGSEFVHTRLTVGDRLPVGPPRNQFPLVTGARYLFVAGGIGITPLLPMIEEVDQRGMPWQLVYGGRTLPGMAFQPELERYGDAVTLWPQDRFGHPDLASVLDVPADTRVYACGPEPLLSAVQDHGATLVGCSVHIERFAPCVDPGAEPWTAFEVVCTESECTVQVGAEETMLDALVRAGVDMNYDCRQGTCGSCELDLVEGPALHLDSVLDADAPDRGSLIFPCVSRARGPRVVVDI